MDIERATMLLAQTREICEDRTRERDEARAALAKMAQPAELGRSLEGLIEQLMRLRRTPGLPFDLTLPGVIADLRSEIDELTAAEPRSAHEREELGDVVSLAVALVVTYGLARGDVTLMAIVDEAAAKIDRRLTLVEAGATWAEAKRT